MIIAARNFLHESTATKDFVPMNVLAPLAECVKLKLVRFAAKCFRLSNHAGKNTVRLSVTTNHDVKNNETEVHQIFLDFGADFDDFKFRAADFVHVAGLNHAGELVAGVHDASIAQFGKSHRSDKKSRPREQSA